MQRIPYKQWVKFGRLGLPGYIPPRKLTCPLKIDGADLRQYARPDNNVPSNMKFKMSLLVVDFSMKPGYQAVGERSGEIEIG